VHLSYFPLSFIFIFPILLSSFSHLFSLNVTCQLDANYIPISFLLCLQILGNPFRGSSGIDTYIQMDWIFQIFTFILFCLFVCFLLPPLVSFISFLIFVCIDLGYTVPTVKVFHAVWRDNIMKYFLFLYQNNAFVRCRTLASQTLLCRKEPCT
jgi:hypothetical protein